MQAQAGKSAVTFERVAGELKLTPQQKLDLVPILEQEAPQVQAVERDSSLSDSQKLARLQAIHNQTDPRVKPILTAEQYKKWQRIRQKEIQDAVKERPPQ